MEKIENVLKLSEKIKNLDDELVSIEKFKKAYDKDLLITSGGQHHFDIGFSIKSDIGISEKIVDFIEQLIKIQREELVGELNSFLKLE